MFERVLVMYIYAETPIHPGSGTTLGGIVDLPIQRERHTEFPMVQGASIKGVLRNSAKDLGITDRVKIKEGNKEVEKDWIDVIFGEENRVGSVSVTDARILAFPVRTLKGVFGWITCPLVLNRYKRDLNLAKYEVNWDLNILKIEDKEAVVSQDSNVKIIINGKGYIFVEDLQLEVKTVQEGLLKDIANKISEAFPRNNIYNEIKEKLERDLIVVSDNVFRDLVSLTTEVATRIKIDPKTGTVVSGALWSEEYLPTDTIMYSLILIPSRLNSLSSNEIAKKLNQYNEKVLQIGGDETIGKGLAIVKLVEGGSKNVEKS